MKKILISIEDKQQKILDSLKEKGINKSKALRAAIELLCNATEDTTFIALNSKGVRVVKDCGAITASTFDGTIDSMDLTYQYSDNEVKCEKFECKINLKR